jgi:hypothetical protein
MARMETPESKQRFEQLFHHVFQINDDVERQEVEDADGVYVVARHFPRNNVSMSELRLCV